MCTVKEGWYWLLWVIWSHPKPLISICPSGDVSKRTTAVLMDTLPWAPVHPFHPSMPLSPQSSIMSLSEIQLRNLGPVVCSAAQISCLFPLLKPLLAPQLPGCWKITALSAKCGRCFSRISWPGEYCLSPPECKRSTLCCHPGCLACLLSWMAG